MKFFQKRGVAVTLMVLAIVASIAWGQYKKPAGLPKVSAGTWVYDGANVLSAETEQLIERYDADWNDSYYALCAVATVESAGGWAIDDYTLAVGEAWQLEYNDLLLVIDVSGENDDEALWGIQGGSDIMSVMTSAEQNRISAAISSSISQGRYDEAIRQLFPVLDEVYAAHYSASTQGGGFEAFDDYYGGSYESGWEDVNSTGRILTRFLFALLIVFIIWIILDRIRYNRYRRRYMAPGIGVPTVRYYPIFWGRGLYRPRPSAPPHPPAYHNNNNRRPPTGGFGGGSRPPTGGTRPSGGSYTRPSGSSRPYSGSFGSFGGFHGGSRGSSGFTRGGGSGFTRGGGFGGGGVSRGGGGGFGSRGGFHGGRR